MAVGLAAACVLAATAACGGSSDTKAKPAAGGSPQATTAATRAAANPTAAQQSSGSSGKIFDLPASACALVTKEDAEKALGEPVDAAIEGTTTSDTDPESQQAGCEYNAAAGDNAYLSLEIKRKKDASTAKLDWDISVRRGDTSTSQKLSGLGDEAFIEASPTGASAEVLKSNLEFIFGFAVVTPGVEAGPALTAAVTSAMGRHK